MKQTHITKLVLILTLGLFASTVHAVTLVSYNFVGEPGDQVTTATSSVDADLSASVLSRGAGLTPLVSADSMSAINWDIGALSPGENKYYEFTLTPDGGYQFTLDQIDLTLLRSGNAAKDYTVYTSLDSYAAPATNTLDDVGTSADLTFIPLIPANFQNIQESVTFRLYGYDSLTAGSGVLFKETFDVTGTTSVVPEASTLTWAVAASLLGLVVAYRRRKR